MVENLSVNLARLGHEVKVITLDLGDKLPSVEEYKGVTVKRFRGYAPSSSYFIPSPKILSYLRRAEADIIHVHNIGALLAPTAWLALKMRKNKPRYIITPHHHESGSKWHTKLLWKPYKPIARRVVRNADVVHSVSEYEAELIKRYFNVTPIVVPNGVTEDVFGFKWSPPKDKIVLTYAGRVEKYKCIDLVVHVAKMLRDKFFENKQVTVRIIGQGTDLKRVLSIAKSLDINVEHYGFLPRKEYFETMSKSTVFINLSKYEAYSIVTAEALAMNMPVVVAEPWGRTFENIAKAYIVKRMDIKGIANIVASIAENTSVHSIIDDTGCSKNDVIMSWSKAAKLIVEKIYESSLSR